MEFDQDLLEIFGELNRDRLMELVVRYARDRLDAGGVSIFLRDDITGNYVLRGTTGLEESATMPDRRVEYQPGEGLTGWIAKHGQPLRIANVMDAAELWRIADDLTWSKKFSEISSKAGRAYIGVPIMAKDGQTVLGVLRVSGQDVGHHFDDEDELLLSRVAAMVSIAIENSQRYEQEKRRARYFGLLLNIDEELDPRRPVGEMLRAVAGRVKAGFRIEACHIYLRDEYDPGRLVLRAASGTPAEMVNRVMYRVGEGLSGHVANNAEPTLIRDPDVLADWSDSQIEEIVAHLPSKRYRSFLGAPLHLADETLGVIELINKVPSKPGHRDWFTDGDAQYLDILSTGISAVLEGARYLKTLSEVGVTAMRMQRVATFGSLAQRVRHEAANPLAVARLATTNLRRDLQSWEASHELGGLPEKIAGRLDAIETGLSAVGDRLQELLRFSQRAGFAKVARQWNDVVREAIIWLAAERTRRGMEVHIEYGDLPVLFIEPNELFGVVVTLLQVMMEALNEDGGEVVVNTALTDDGRYVRTQMRCAAAHPEIVSTITDAQKNSPLEPSPLHFDWALARETVEKQYAGALTWEVTDSEVRLVLDLPVNEQMGK